MYLMMFELCQFSSCDIFFAVEVTSSCNIFSPCFGSVLLIQPFRVLYAEPGRSMYVQSRPPLQTTLLLTAQSLPIVA